MIFEVKLETPVIGLGKNNYIVLKNGIHAPNKNFKKWKKAVILEIYSKIKNLRTWEHPCKLTLFYHPSDKRRRDATGILDGVFNVLEEIRVINDDSQIKQINYQEINDDVDYSLYIRLDAI